MVTIKGIKKFSIQARAVGTQTGLSGILRVCGSSDNDLSRIVGLTIPFSKDGEEIQITTKRDEMFFYGEIVPVSPAGSSLEENYRSGRLPESVVVRLNHYWDRIGKQPHTSSEMTNFRTRKIDDLVSVYSSRNRALLRGHYFRIPYPSFVNEQMARSNKALIDYLLEQAQIRVVRIVDSLVRIDIPDEYVSLDGHPGAISNTPKELLEKAIETREFFYSNGERKIKVDRRDDMQVPEPVIYGGKGANSRGAWGR